MQASLSPAAILDVVAKLTGVSRRELLAYSGPRDTPRARARQIATYLIRKRLKLSTPAIGRVMERDHSTVLENYRRIEALLPVDERLSGLVERIERRLDELHPAPAPAPKTRAKRKPRSRPKPRPPMPPKPSYDRSYGRANERQANSKPAPRPDQPKTRNCLMCRTSFRSSWPGERVCKRCRETEAWRAGIA